MAVRIGRQEIVFSSKALGIQKAYIAWEKETILAYFSKKATKDLEDIIRTALEKEKKGIGLSRHVSIGTGGLGMCAGIKLLGSSVLDARKAVNEDITLIIFSC